MSNLILQLLEPQSWWEMAGTWLDMLYNSGLAAFAIVTLLFAWFYHKGVRITEPFNFDDLPPVPKKSEVIPKWESIAGICMCIVFAVLFLLTPQVCSAVVDGKVICLLDVEAVRSSWPLILLFAVCGIAREVVQLMEGRYNRKVLVTALVTDLISGLLAIWWLVGFEILNPVFLANMERIFTGENNIVFWMFGNFDMFFLSVMMFALLLDAADVTVKTLHK